MLTAVVGADGGRAGRVFTGISVRFLHDTSETDAARIIAIDIQMLHDESWKP